ncbi:DNA replication ATP-dependent helicase/nuclease DNA2-like [Pyrus ussuriensis x Pyrus communis]|uniref:DNA replication ATP-dependent helicase/nuclease n=1 Tax=Pyrus ussuriensis x Pyrus communis TaxID=2448454 RepID=A0A5N5HJF1_9ROSA|nr:DNA replication ATP-dependent helicase/nuclease DNA2-like [Pyrus ussuriensis x Pyrus communis]
MPGTGKTSTMVHGVKALLIRGSSILLTSYTNSAVDNLLVKLKAEHGRILILYASEDMKLCMKKFEAIAFQVSLGPLMFASKFVLVGDHYQLPPLSTEARENGMGVSLFCRLSEVHPQAISALQGQYRMCRGIMELSNALIYGDRLRCGSPEIENVKLKVSSSISHSFIITFCNVDSLPAFEEKDHKIVSNPTEANIIVQVVEGLVKSGIKGEDIGVITPYNSQADIIRLALNRLTSVEIHTIGKYQVRINVALTRAKVRITLKKLIMFGSCKTLSNVVLMKLLIEQVEQQSGILNVSNKDIKFNSELRGCSQTQVR